MDSRDDFMTEPFSGRSFVIRLKSQFAPDTHGGAVIVLGHHEVRCYRCYFTFFFFLYLVNFLDNLP